MIDCGSLEFAQARVQARHGARVDVVAWRRLEALRLLVPWLEQARATSLRPWLVDITAQSSGHEIEAALRKQWRAQVAEVAAWMPLAWQAAVQWCAAWPELAVLQHLARGGSPSPWMQEDAVWRPWCEAAAPDRAGGLRGGVLAPLQAGWARPDTLGDAWLAEWKQRWPGPPGAGLLELHRALAEHAQAFARSPSAQGSALRSALRGRLVLLMRRTALQPAVSFIHLALAALDLERLRGELLRRVLFRDWRVS